MSRPNIKDRIAKTYRVWSELLKKQNLTGEQLVTGAVAGDVAVSGIKLGDNLVSVFNMTALTDLTSEFEITADGVINNTGGTSTAAAVVKVFYEQWMLR